MRRRAFTNVQTFGGHAAVADAEVPAEQAAMSAGLATPVKVLKAGQHGSNSSSSLASRVRGCSVTVGDTGDGVPAQGVAGRSGRRTR